MIPGSSRRYLNILMGFSAIRPLSRQYLFYYYRQIGNRRVRLSAAVDDSFQGFYSKSDGAISHSLSGLKQAVSSLEEANCVKAECNGKVLTP